MKGAIGAALVLALAGCPTDEPAPDRVELSGLTAAPPASTASIVSRDGNGEDVYEIELSLGVAIATRCWDTCGPDSACTLAKLTAQDPSILGVRPVYRGGRREGEFALVASRAGTTTLHVQTSCTGRDYRVTVRPWAGSAGGSRLGVHCAPRVRSTRGGRVDRQQLPDPGEARDGGDGGDLSGARRERRRGRALLRAQADPARPRERRALRADVPRRGAARRAAPAPEHRAGLRHREARRLVLLHDGVRARRDGARAAAARAVAAARAAARRAC